MADLAATFSDEVTCAICHDYYKTPKLLGCLHRYCRDCLHDYVTKQAREKSVVCPTCRHVTNAPRVRNKRRLSVDEYADHFPTDFLLQTMVERIKKLKSSDSCSTHLGNPIVLLCQDCRQSICHVCAGVDHRNCNGVIPLKSEADKERARLQKQLHSLQEEKKISKENEEKIKESMELLNETFEQVNKTIVDECEQIQKLVSAKQDILMCNVRKRICEESVELRESSQAEERIQARIAESEKILIDSLKNKSDFQLLLEKIDVAIPKSREIEKRQIPSCEDFYNDEVKKYKLRETIEFLSDASSGFCGGVIFDV